MQNQNEFGPVMIHQPSPRTINGWNRKLWARWDVLAGPPIQSESLRRALRRFRKRRLNPLTPKNGPAVSDVATLKETPGQHLAAHKITRKLRNLGVTDEQLKSVQFKNQSGPFDQWPWGSSGTLPSRAIPSAKAYCALKWLILENPTCSRDKDDAWRLVGEAMFPLPARPSPRISYAQSERAKKPRGKITDDGKTIGQAIEKLAKWRNDGARELWPHLFALLSENGLNPVEIEDPRNPRKTTYVYDFMDGRKRKEMCFGRFANIVSKIKKSH